MKLTNKVLGMAGLVALVVLACVFAGCGMLGSKGAGTPPTALERKFFDVTTNFVEKVVTRTNTVTVTNAVVETLWTTNVDHHVEVLMTTNYQTVVTPMVVTVTNTVEQYVETPNSTAKATAAVGGVAGAPFGVGGVVSTVVAGLFAGWAGYRNRQYAGRNSVLEQTAGVLSQNVETAREVIANTPQGAQLGQLFKNYLLEHQSAAGVVQHVTEIVDENVNVPEAKQAAQEIAGLVQQVRNLPGPGTAAAPRAAGPVQTSGPAVGI